MPKKSPPSNKLYNNLTKSRNASFYQDEFAFRRQPTVAKDYSPTKAYTTPVMAIGAINAHTGDLVYESATVVEHTHFTPSRSIYS